MNMHVKDNDADHTVQNSQMFGSLVLSRHTTSSHGSATTSYFRVAMHAVLYSVMNQRLKLLRHHCPKKSLVKGPISYVRYSMPPHKVEKPHLISHYWQSSSYLTGLHRPFESRNMRAPASQLRYATLSSITNPMASSALIYKRSTSSTSKR